MLAACPFSQGHGWKRHHREENGGGVRHRHQGEPGAGRGGGAGASSLRVSGRSGGLTLVFLQTELGLCTPDMGCQVSTVIHNFISCHLRSLAGFQLPDLHYSRCSPQSCKVDVIACICQVEGMWFTEDVRVVQDHRATRWQRKNLKFDPFDPQDGVCPCATVSGKSVVAQGAELCCTGSRE